MSEGTSDSIDHALNAPPIAGMSIAGDPHDFHCVGMDINKYTVIVMQMQGNWVIACVHLLLWRAAAATSAALL